MDIHVKRVYEHGTGLTLLYDPETGDGLIALKGPIDEDAFMATNVYGLAEESRRLATEVSVTKDIPENEFRSLCEKAKNYKPSDWLNYDSKEIPTIISIIKEFSVK